MPLYNWSGMVMLKHYGVNAEMGIPEMTKEKNPLTQKRYFNIYAEKDIHIELQ